jgi:hypothetical protein
MKRATLNTAAMALAFALIQTPASAQHTHDGPPLHLNPRWEECSFQLDPSLTQAAWRQFTQEAGLVVYFRPVADARPMGRGNFEVSAVRWETGIDDADAAWNDTFVHPDEHHSLFEGSRLAFPGLMLRAGVSNSTDVGLYVTKSPGANYGFAGAQVQYNLAQTTGGWAASARTSFVTMYGPEDLDFTVYGVDFLASRTFAVARWAAVSPYAGVSTYLAASHENTSAVALRDERVVGLQTTAGAAVQLSKARLGVEYNVAKVPSVSFKLGFGL